MLRKASHSSFILAPPLKSKSNRGSSYFIWMSKRKKEALTPSSYFIILAQVIGRKPSTPQVRAHISALIQSTTKLKKSRERKHLKKGKINKWKFNSTCTKMSTNQQLWLSTPKIGMLNALAVPVWNHYKFTEYIPSRISTSARESHTFSKTHQL